MEENNWKDCKLKKFLVESGTTNGSQLRKTREKRDISASTRVSRMRGSSCSTRSFIRDVAVVFDA